MKGEGKNVQMADFVNTLMEMRQGNTAVDCTNKFSELIAAIMDTGKKGVLTLKLTVSPGRMAHGVVKDVEITHSCVIAKPEFDSGTSIFFTTEDGELVRNDPGQMPLELSREERENAR